MLQSAYTINYFMQRSSTCYGILLFAMFMKLFKFLSMIFPRFSLINMTLAHALGDIFVFAVLMLVIIAAFTGLYFFSYGTYFREFSTLPRTAYWVIMNVALLADPSEFFEVDPVTSTFLLVISTALGTWLFSTIIIAVITESFLKCKAEIAARLAASEQEKLQWMGKLLAWLADPEPYVPVLRPHNIVERVAAITEKAASGALATVRGNTSRFISVRSVRSHASDDNRWRRAAGGVLNSQSEGAPATELADVRLGSTSASGAYSGGLPLADASSKSAASPSAAAAAAPPPLKRKLTSKFFSVVANAVRESEPSAPLQRYWLKVVVWSATNVCDVGQVADPHVKLHVLHGGALHREVQKSATIRNNREPEWNAPFLLHVPAADAALVLSCWDSDQFSADDLLAYIVLPISMFEPPAAAAADDPGDDAAAAPSALNFEFLLRASEAQKKSHREISLFQQRSDEPEPIRLRVSACLHRMEEGRPGLHTGRSTAKSGRFTARKNTVQGDRGGSSGSRSVAGSFMVDQPANLPGLAETSSGVEISLPAARCPSLPAPAPPRELAREAASGKRLVAPASGNVKF